MNGRNYKHKPVGLAHEEMRAGIGLSPQQIDALRYIAMSPHPVVGGLRLHARTVDTLAKARLVRLEIDGGGDQVAILTAGGKKLAADLAKTVSLHYSIPDGMTLGELVKHLTKAPHWQKLKGLNARSYFFPKSKEQP